MWPGIILLLGNHWSVISVQCLLFLLENWNLECICVQTQTGEVQHLQFPQEGFRENDQGLEACCPLGKQRGRRRWHLIFGDISGLLQELVIKWSYPGLPIWIWQNIVEFDCSNLFYTYRQIYHEIRFHLGGCKCSCKSLLDMVVGNTLNAAFIEM